MSTVRHITGSFILASLSLLTAPGPASAQNADAAEVQRYSLSEAALAKYTQATRSLAALSSDCEDEDDDEDSESQSIDDMVAQLGTRRGATGAVQSAGMTPREYVVFSLSLLQNGLAAWAASQPGGGLPAGVSKANVDFVTKHEAELTRLGELQSQGACDDEADEETADEDSADE